MAEIKFTPQEFIDDLKRVISFKDNRVLIWYCNLYIEHLVKLIYKKYKNDFNYGQCNVCKKSLEPSFMLKVEELSGAKIIDCKNGHDALIKMVNVSRNTAGHELDFKEEKIIEIINKVLSKAIIVDPQGSISRILNNITPWKKFEISAIAVFAGLYKNYQQIISQTSQNRLIFRINETYTDILPEIVSNDDPRYRLSNI